MTSQVARIESELSEMTSQRYNVLAANAATHFIKALSFRMPKGKVTSDGSQSQSQLEHSTTMLESAATDLYEKREIILGNFGGLDNDCLKILLNFEKVLAILFVPGGHQTLPFFYMANVFLH